MSDSSPQQSLGDFAAILVREIAQSLLLAREHAPFVEVRTVNLRLGQLSQDEDSNETPTAPDGLILNERYPLLDSGWQLELELDNKVQASLNGEPIDIPETSRTAIDLLGTQPVSIIKGISKEWSKRLAAAQINTVQQLANLTDQQLQQIIAQQHSLLPREFRSKAQLLETPVPPLPHSGLSETKIYQLLLEPQANLQQQFGKQKVSATELSRFSALLDALNIAVDSDLLRQISLTELLDS